MKKILIAVTLVSSLSAHAWVNTERYPGYDTPGAAFICAGLDVGALGFLSALTSHFALSKPGSPLVGQALRIRNVSGGVAIVGLVGAVVAYVAAARRYGGNFDSGRCYVTRARIASDRGPRP